jgi:hypothetical protein
MNRPMMKCQTSLGMWFGLRERSRKRVLQTLIKFQNSISFGVVTVESAVAKSNAPNQIKWQESTCSFRWIKGSHLTRC